MDAYTQRLMEFGYVPLSVRIQNSISLAGKVVIGSARGIKKTYDYSAPKIRKYWEDTKPQREAYWAEIRPELENAAREIVTDTRETYEFLKPQVKAMGNKAYTLARDKIKNYRSRKNTTTENINKPSKKITLAQIISGDI